MTFSIGPNEVKFEKPEGRDVMDAYVHECNTRQTTWANQKQKHIYDDTLLSLRLFLELMPHFGY